MNNKNNLYSMISKSLHACSVLFVCIASIPVLCGWTKNNFLDVRNSLSLQILSAERAGRGGHAIKVEVELKNRGDEPLVIDCDALSLDVWPQKESGEYGVLFEAYHLKQLSLSKNEGFYDPSKQRYIYLYPNDRVKRTFIAGYIGDAGIHERRLHSWGDTERERWMQGTVGNAKLEIGYIVTDYSVFDSFDSNFITFGCNSVCSPPFEVNLWKKESISPPLSLYLLDARMVTNEGHLGAQDQIEYTIRIESTTNEVVTVDKRLFFASISWDDKEDLLQYNASGLSFVPPMKSSETIDSHHLLSIPPNGARILTQRTQYFGRWSMYDFFPELFPPVTFSNDNWEHQYWINRVAEKYRICIGYQMPYLRSHPSLLIRADLASESQTPIFSEFRETTLGQTRFVGEAWLHDEGLHE